MSAAPLSKPAGAAESPARTSSAPASSAPTSLALVGAGVRGTQLLLQLSRTLRVDGDTLDLHVIDPFPFGAGRTWRTDQSDALLMNGPTESVSAFRLGEGPDLVTWLDSQTPDRPSRRGEFPSRNVYGRYLAWAFEQALAALPARVRVHRHREWVRSVLPTADGGYRLVLDPAGQGARQDGTTAVSAAVVILALGWLEAQSHHGVSEGLPERAAWIAPGHPAEQDLSTIADGAPVLVRGLGMGFFDALSLLTIGRGGSFQPHPDGGGRLDYVASGREPVVHVGSRRGVPFRAKAGRPVGTASDRDVVLPRNGPHPALEATLRAGTGPLTAADGLLEAVLADARDAVAAAGGDPSAVTFEALEAPLAGRTWETWQQVHEATLAELEHDVAETRRAATSPLKAAHRSIGESRRIIAPVLQERGIDASAWPAYQRILRLGAMLAGGPPLERAEQLLALVRAGVVRFLGPDTVMTVAADARAADTQTEQPDGAAPALQARSPHVDSADGPQASVLLDAWMHAPSLATTVDPLLRSLLDTGLARVHRVAPNLDGESDLEAGGPPSGAIDVEVSSGAMVGADGRAQPRLLALGIPTEGARAFTILSPFPGVDERAIDECARAAVHVAGLLDGEG